MTFYSEKQRKAVMAMMNRIGRESDSIRSKSVDPMIIKIGGGDDPEELERKNNEYMGKIKSETHKLELEIKRDNYFSEKERGSVPLLETTYVIRGGQPKERQTVKRLLDVIGNEPALSGINTIRIDNELQVPFEFNLEARAVSIRNSELHVKGSDIPVDLAISILTQATLIKNPQFSEDAAFEKAKEAVSIYLLEKEHREKRIKEIESAEVYKIGDGEQPSYEISEYMGPVTTPIEAKITQAAPTGESEEKLMGVGYPSDFDRKMEESVKSSMFSGGINENK